MICWRISRGYVPPFSYGVGATGDARDVAAPRPAILEAAISGRGHFCV